MKCSPDRLLLLGVACLSQVALAQAPQILPEITVKKPVQTEPLKPTSPPEAAADIPSVIVVAERPTNRIDRQVYDVKADVGSTNGTAADALNNIPSVAVALDGTVSLRGSTRVQIMIDGKPSAMMQGDNRGATLNAMPSDDIESIEVINNPGAQFGNEAGGGPILNLVMRRNRKPGGSANVNGNAGTAGRHNSSASGSYNEGLFGVQGGVNVRHDGRNSVGGSVRDLVDPFSGRTIHTTQTSSSAGLNDSAGLNAAMSYNIGAKDTFSANMAYATSTNDNRSADHYLIDAPGLPIPSDYVRTTQRTGANKNSIWGARLDHKGSTDGETLKLDLRVSGSNNTADNSYANIYAISTSHLSSGRNRQLNEADIRIGDFTGDYERPYGHGLLKLGFKVADNKNSLDARYTEIGPLTATETVNFYRSNQFKLDETNLALYGSYQMRLNERWGVLGGLRVEHTSLDINQLTSQVHATNNYLNAIPSLFATYKLSNEASIRFSYAHRLRRPGASELNPFVVYHDEQNVSSGNPKLKPTQTDSFELGYETRIAGLETNLRGYYREDKDAIVDHRYFINNTVLLTTRDNGGSSRANGIEITVSGKLMPKLMINTSANLARSEQALLDANGAYIDRKSSSLSLRARVNYQVTESDQLQLMVNRQGRSQFGLGYREPNSTANFSIRHALTPALNLLLSITDVFNSNRLEMVNDTPLFKETMVRQYDGRLIYLGLSYRFGGVTPIRRSGGGGQRPDGPK